MSYSAHGNTTRICFATKMHSSNGDILAEEYGPSVLPETHCPDEAIGLEGIRTASIAQGGACAQAAGDATLHRAADDAWSHDEGGTGTANLDLTFDLDLDFEVRPEIASPIFVPSTMTGVAGVERPLPGLSGGGVLQPELSGEGHHPSSLVPVSLSSDRAHEDGSKFSRAIARYRAQGFDFFQIAGKLILSVLRKKEALLTDLSEIDGSWQSSVAWIADMIQDEETRDPVIDALFLLMDGERIKGRPDLIERHDEILAACARIRASGRHRRDQIIMRLGSIQDEVGVVLEKHSGAARLCVPIVIHAQAKAISQPYLFVAHPMTGFQRNIKKTLLSMGDFGRSKIAWHQTEAIEALFRRMQSAVLADERIQEVVFYWQTEGERRIALAFMNILSTLWNVPAFGRGEMDFVYMESARVAAIRMAKN